METWRQPFWQTHISISTTIKLGFPQLVKFFFPLVRSALTLSVEMINHLFYDPSCWKTDPSRGLNLPAHPPASLTLSVPTKAAGCPLARRAQTTGDRHAHAGLMMSSHGNKKIPETLHAAKICSRHRPRQRKGLRSEPKQTASRCPDKSADKEGEERGVSNGADEMCV